MRTYEIHASAKQVQRTTGRSSVAASAYRTASLIYDDRTGLTHDYRNKKGVEHSEIITPDNAPAWAQDRGQLWNAVEEKESRINSMTAREWVIAFPREFNIFQRKEAGEAIATERMERLNTAVEISYHKPDKIIDKDTGEISDNANHHAHIMFPTRGFDSETHDGWSKNKYRYYSHDKIEIDGKKIKSSEHEINQMRKFAAAEMNRIALRDGLNVKTEYLSFEERGIDKEPTQHLGHVASDMKKNGKESERQNINLNIKASNDNREELKKEKKIIILDHERKKRALNKQIYDRDAQEINQQKALSDSADQAAKKQLKIESEAKNILAKKSQELRNNYNAELRVLKNSQRGNINKYVQGLRSKDSFKEAKHRAYYEPLIKSQKQEKTELQNRLDQAGLKGSYFRFRRGKDAREKITALDKNIDNATMRLNEGIGGLDRFDYRKIIARKQNNTSQVDELKKRLDENLKEAEGASQKLAKDKLLNQSMKKGNFKHEQKTTKERADKHLQLARNPLQDLRGWMDETGSGGKRNSSVLARQNRSIKHDNELLPVRGKGREAIAEQDNFKDQLLSKEEIAENVKAQNSYHPDNKETGSLMDGLSAENRAKIEIYKRDNPAKEGKELNEKQDQSHKPELE